jgi:hypothetical protein
MFRQRIGNGDYHEPKQSYQVKLIYKGYKIESNHRIVGEVQVYEFSIGRLKLHCTCN